MWPSPFSHITPPASAAAAGNGFSSQANQQQFPPGFQQQIPQATPMHYPIATGGVASFQPLGSPLALHSPFTSKTVSQNPLMGPQVTPATFQVPNSSPMQRPCPREIPSTVPQSSPFNSSLWQMRNLSPPAPPPGLTHPPFMPSNVPSPRGVLSPPQRPFAPSTVPTPVGSVIPSQRSFAPCHVPSSLGTVSTPQRPFAPSPVSYSIRSVTPHQSPFAPSTLPSPGGVTTQPQRPFVSSAVPYPRGAATPPQSPFTPSNLPSPRGVTTQPQTPFAPSSVPYPRVAATPPQSPFAPSTLPSPRGVTTQPQTPFVPSTVPFPRGAATPPQSPFAPSTLPSPVGVTTPPQRLFAPSTVPYPRGAATPPQSPFATSTLPSPGVVATPPQRLFAPSTLSAHRGFPMPPQQQFITPAVPSPKRVLSPPQQPFVPTTVPSPRGIMSPVQQSALFNSPPQGRFQPLPQQPTVPSPRVLSPPQQPFVTSTVAAPSPSGITYPGQQPSPFNSPPWQVRNSQPSSPNLHQGPAVVPSILPSPRGMPSPVQQSLPLSNSIWHQRSPQPSGFGINQGPSIAAALDRHIMEKTLRGVAGQGTNVHPLPPPQQFIPIGQSARWRAISLSDPQKMAGFHKDGERGREHRNRRHYSPGSFGSGPRISRCFSPPPPDIVRVMKSVASEEYYIKKENDQVESCHVEGTEKLTELQDRFEKEILNMKSLEQDDDDDESISSEKSHHTNQDNSDVESLAESDVNGSPVKSRLRLFASDDEENSDEDSSEDESHALSDSSSESDNDEGVDLSDDDDEEDDDDEGSKGPSVVEIRKRKIEDPRRLHPELWFNESGETNDGPVCRCSSSDKRQGIRHGIYPGETVITPCNPLKNNADKLHHYWVTVTPHTNFMTSNASIIHVEGKDYTFEGFSLFCHHSLEQVPLCSVIRFNIEYTLHVVSQPVPENFCIKDLDLFSEFLFNKVLELTDWDLSGNIQDSCQRYHFMPRFVHRTTVDSKACHELLPMNQVLCHVLNSAEPLVKLSHFDLSTEKWEEYNKSCRNAIVMNPDKKPAALRVDDLQFCKDAEGLCKGKVYPNIVHNSIRPVQMSFAGDPKYQRLLKSHNKLRNLISNTPVPTHKNRDKLVKLKIELEKMRLTSSMRRDVLVEVSSKGMIKTGLKSDICQHALLLPVLVHHVRYHMCLRALDKKMGYIFKDRALFQLALTHPSYHLNFGMNPDHARNSLSNCGVKQPRYGDRKIRHLHTRKKGITQLIRVMSNLGKMEEHQSMIRHNERLEFLGDAVLELISSTHLYFMLPSKPEGYLAMYRSALVQNRHLAQLAKKLGLSDYMQYSHGPDLCVEEDLNHAMANCFEALLGAMYLENGLESATELFTKLSFEEEELREVWTSMPKHPLQAQMPDGDRHLIASSELLQKLQEFEQASGIEFTHIRLLARAFTHAQVGFNNLTLGSNQRMEFLGDSVLQFVVSVYLFKHFPEHHEGHLTLLRSSLVNHRIQAKLARELGLDKLINFGAQTTGMKAFREKLLADILEAFVAALYVDKGLRHVEVFCRVCLFPRLEEFIINQDWMDAKSQLQQCCLTAREQGRTPDLPQYKILENKGPAHHKHYKVAVYYKNRRLGSGEGKSIQQAEMAAAKDALASHYFPEYARQKRLLDRKHWSGRRNYWNKVPRREIENDDQEEKVKLQPQWEEIETFEVDENSNATENWEEDENSQERENWEKEDRTGCETTENWESESSDTRENWEQENSRDTRENWEQDNSRDTREKWEQEKGRDTRDNPEQENRRNTREDWEQENSRDTRDNPEQENSRDTRENWEQEKGRDTRENPEQENSRDKRENWEQENSRDTRENWEQENSRDTREDWEQENSRDTRENWEQEKGRDTRENWEQENSRDTRENWEQENSRDTRDNPERENSRNTRDNPEQEDSDARENWQLENNNKMKNWEEQNGHKMESWEEKEDENVDDMKEDLEVENVDLKENWEEEDSEGSGNSEAIEDCDEALGVNEVSLLKENWEETKDENSEPKELWEVD